MFASVPRFVGIPSGPTMIVTEISLCFALFPLPFFRTVAEYSRSFTEGVVSMRRCGFVARCNGIDSVGRRVVVSEVATEAGGSDAMTEGNSSARFKLRLTSRSDFFASRAITYELVGFKGVPSAFDCLRVLRILMAL